MKVFLVRHGEALSNRADLRKYNRSKTNNLTGRGRKQARLLGEKFKDMDIEAVYSSDIPRAIQTAEEVLKHHPNLDLIIDKRLREHNQGKVLNFFKYIKEESKRTGKNKDMIVPEEGESHNDVKKRFDEFFEELKEKHKGNVVIASHGMAKSIYLKGTDWLSSWFNRVMRPNTGVSELELKDNKFVLNDFFSISHLDEIEKIRYYANLAALMPYKVLPFEEEKIDFTLREGDCRHKTQFLKNAFDKEGIEYRELVALFEWQDLPIPQELLDILKKSSKRWTHQLLEVKIGDKWLKIDPVWDKTLGHISFPTTSISRWEGDSDIGRVSLGEIEYIPKDKFKKEDYGIKIDKEEAHVFAEKLNEFLEEKRKEIKHN